MRRATAQATSSWSTAPWWPDGRPHGSLPGDRGPRTAGETPIAPLQLGVPRQRHRRRVGDAPQSIGAARCRTRSSADEGRDRTRHAHDPFRCGACRPDRRRAARHVGADLAGGRPGARPHCPGEGVPARPEHRCDHHTRRCRPVGQRHGLVSAVPTPRRRPPIGSARPSRRGRLPHARDHRGCAEGQPPRAATQGPHSGTAEDHPAAHVAIGHPSRLVDGGHASRDSALSHHRAVHRRDIARLRCRLRGRQPRRFAELRLSHRGPGAMDGQHRRQGHPRSSRCATFGRRRRRRHLGLEPWWPSARSRAGGDQLPACDRCRDRR